MYEKFTSNLLQCVKFLQIFPKIFLRFLYLPLLFIINFFSFFEYFPYCLKNVSGIFGRCPKNFSRYLKFFSPKFNGIFQTFFNIFSKILEISSFLKTFPKILGKYLKVCGEFYCEKNFRICVLRENFRNTCTENL